MALDTKVKAVAVLDSVMNFLFGNPGAEVAPTVESVTQNGGIALMFEVKPKEGVRFGHRLIENRRYRNPKSTQPETDYVRVNGRRFVEMSMVVDAGTSTFEADGAAE